MPKATYDSDTSGEFSDEDYVTGSDAEIDPSLAPGPSKIRKDSLPMPDISDSDDEDFPEPVIFSDDDGFESGHDDLDDGFSLRDNIKAASGFRVRKKPKSASYLKRRLMRASDKSNDPEVRHNMAKANEAFVKQDLSAAWKHYMEVIKLDPKNFNAYRTLGEICQMRGNLNKCCLYWLLAAECGESDGDFWAMVAELSAELGHVDQAIHCYTHAIAKSEGKNPLYILERAILYKQKKQLGHALAGFRRVREFYPADSSIVKHLASVYVEQKRLADAIELYLRMLDSNMHPKPFVVYPKFNWSELNIACELFMSQHSWLPGIELIKMVARWKQGRADEDWWDTADDAEFDEMRRRKYLASKKSSHLESLMLRDFQLPIDIRFKLGCFRLELDQVEEALSHFTYLFHEKREEVVDLFYDAGSSLEAKGHYQAAIQYLSCSDLNNEDSGHACFLLGNCYLEVNDYARAAEYLSRALDMDPDNLEFKLSFIEALYHTGDVSTASQLLEEISKSQLSRGKDKTPTPLPSELEGDEKDADENQDFALIENKRHFKNQKSQLLTEEEKQEIEDHATRLVVGKFKRMKRFEDAIDQGQHVAASAWMKFALQLIELFMEVRTFFPKNRKTTFKGIVKYKSKKSGIEQKVERIHNLISGLAQPHTSRMELTSQTEYRGLSYDTWLYIFVQYAYLVNQFENDMDQAIEIIDIASDVSVFVQNKTRSTLLKIARLTFGIIQEDYAVAVSNNVRHLLTSSQFSPKVYNFFMCCFASGVSAWAAFSNYNHQKYFLRHLKAYDSLLTSTKVSGSAQVTIDPKDFTTGREHPQLLYIYACLLGSNRTYSSPIVYLTRAYRQYFNDPTICFVLGLAHIHRSMQRNSSNRHIQLLQGISYLMEYKLAREKNATMYELQEIEYNFGRMFHMIGLTTLAVKHYEKVLSYHDKFVDDPDYDMSMEAAYNLTLIYTINGNTELSKEITEKYLVV